MDAITDAGANIALNGNIVYGIGISAAADDDTGTDVGVVYALA